MCGILWPEGTELDKTEDEKMDTGNEGEETGNEENIAPLLQAMNPSAIGLSFIVENCDSLIVQYNWGTYEEIPSKQDPDKNRLDED